MRGTLSPGERRFWEIQEELTNNETTIEEEYERVLNKTSSLSKSQRDYVVLLHTFKKNLNTDFSEEELVAVPKDSEE